MKNFSFLILLSVIAFFVTTAAGSNMGIGMYRTDTFGWPNEVFRVTYDKTQLVSLEPNFINILLNFSLCLAVVISIRIVFLMMKVKRKPSEDVDAMKNHPYFKGNKL